MPDYFSYIRNSVPMMGNEGIGECSQQSSDDKTNEDGDRPLKKAKYMWQVKGKYHLKGPSASSSQNRIPPIQQPPTFAEDEDDPISDNGTECINNNEPTNNNIVEQVCHSRRCCLHTILDYSDSDVDSVSSTESQLNEEWEEVVSMVSSKADDDYYLHK